MLESPRGYEEPNSPSRDLMARFDMAHDRSDRSPEVRAYLENLRPQILGLQRRLRLQTDEDIAGLEKRGDIDMKDVDKLVGLIKAFRKAWRENAVSPSEARKLLRERAIHEAGPAWKEFVETVAWIEMSAAINPETKRHAIVAIARAGEPELAWNLFQDANLFVNKSEGNIVSHAAIWRAYAAAGRTPPFESHHLTDAMRTRGTAYSQETNAFVIDSLIDGGKPAEAAALAQGLSDQRRALFVLIRIRALRPGIAAVIDRKIEEVIGRDPALQILACFARGDASSALTLATDGSREAVAEGYALMGDSQKAFETDLTIFTLRKMKLIGRILVALIERGDVEAFMDKAHWLEDFGNEANPDDLSRIIVRLVEHGEFKLARSLSSHLSQAEFLTSAGLFPDATLTQQEQIWERTRAILPVVRVFADHGIPTDELVSQAKRVASASSGPNGERFAHLRAELFVDVDLRTFKRAAKQFMASSDRAAWDEALADIVDGRKDIADQLTYDPTLP